MIFSEYCRDYLYFRKVMQSVAAAMSHYPEIKALRVYLFHGANGSEVVFDIIVRGKLLGRLSAKPEALGLQLRIVDSPELPSAARHRFCIPPYIWRNLKAVYAVSAPDKDPIWVEIDAGSGRLAVVPWERLLRPVFDVPILRLPHLPLKPFMSRESLDLAMCFSCPAEAGPEAKNFVLKLLKTIPWDLSKNLRLYFFCNPDLQQMLQELKGSLLSANIEIFTPPTHSEVEAGVEAVESTRMEDPSKGQRDGITNPCLTWILDQLNGKSLDGVHFITRCSIREEQGELAFVPLSGSKHEWLFRSNARELAAFLDVCGAWSVALISSLDNSDDSGMRLLQDQIATLRPGPIIVYDLRCETDGQGLLAANRFLYGSKEIPMPDSPELSLVVHPEGTLPSGVVGSAVKWVAGFGLGFWVLNVLTTNAPSFLKSMQTRVTRLLAGSKLTRDLNEYTLSRSLNPVLQSPTNTPASVASAQRMLERAFAHIIGLPDSESRRMAEQALKSLAEIVQKNFQRQGPASLAKDTDATTPSLKLKV